MEKESSQAVERIFAVIEAVAEADEGLGITEIARKVALPKSTVFRISSSLVNKNYFIQDEVNEKYKLGYKFIAIAGDYISKLDIRTAAAPYIHNLSTNLNVTAHIAVLQGQSAIYIEKIQPYSHVCMYSEIGKSIDLFCSALGKSLLIGFNEDNLNNYLNNVNLVQYTKNSLSKDKLTEEIKLARKTLLTYDNEEHEAGIYCIASPVIDYNNKVIAAISISSPDSSILSDSRYHIALLHCGLIISRLFGKKA